MIARDYVDAFARCDVLASPTSPVPGVPHRRERHRSVGDVPVRRVHGRREPGGVARDLGAVRIHEHGAALPIGLQLTAGRLAEDVVLRVAAAYEDATTWHRERPPALGGSPT